MLAQRAASGPECKRWHPASPSQYGVLQTTRGMTVNAAAAAAEPKSAALAAEPGDLTIQKRFSCMRCCDLIVWMGQLGLNRMRESLNLRKCLAGSAEPLGASDAGRAGVNFALHAPAATSVQLCLFDSKAVPLQDVGMTKQVRGM